MDIVERARSMILSPAATWPVVEQESTDFQKLYVPYLVVLATIPAVAGFIASCYLAATAAVCDRLQT